MRALPPGALAPTPAHPFFPPLWRGLVPLGVVVFLEFLAIGLPLSVLPMHVSGTLGFASFVAGLVIGAQSAVTLVTRPAAGTGSDRHGPRRAAVLGLGVSALAGVVYTLSLQVPDPTASIGVLLLGRGLLGLGESLVITSALAWGVALAGKARSGLVMAWIGIAMYGALAFGAPIGSALDAGIGFAGMALAAALAPLVGMLVVSIVPVVRPIAGVRLPFRQVAGMIRLPGLGLALAAVGFGAISGFSTYLFAEHGWSDPALTMTAFGTAYVVARLVFGSLPDRFGGARIALLSASVALVGQLGMWAATSAPMAIAAAALTGFGFSLAFPAFGVEAIRDAPEPRRRTGGVCDVLRRDAGVRRAGARSDRGGAGHRCRLCDGRTRLARVPGHRDGARAALRRRPPDPRGGVPCMTSRGCSCGVRSWGSVGRR